MEAPWVTACSKSKISFQHKPPRLVRWGFHPSPLGPLFIGVSQGGEVCYLAFAQDRSPGYFLGQLKMKWPNTEFAKDVKTSKAVLEALFLRKRPLKLVMTGTEFQHSVWRRIATIPAGATMTYATVARLIKRPKAVRAVGTACGSNPLPVIIPCHRVVASNGGLGGFGGGLPLKRRMLSLERKSL